MCPICLSEEETVEHALWSCKSAMDVWSQGPIAIHKSSDRAEKFKDIFEKLDAKCEQQVMEFFTITARNIWHRRNRLIFQGLFQHPTHIVNQSKQSLEEYKTVHKRSRTNNRGRQMLNTSWNPPPAGFLKINWDAAICEEKGIIGLGLIARDQGGQVVGTKKITQAGFNDPLLAEAIGAYQAVKMAMEMGYVCVLFEGDSSQLMVFSSWKFLFIKRSGNTLAHNLAKSSLNEESDVMALLPEYSHVNSAV
ncbi:uncharacterized protein LOC122313674 [Carya illinoinensis]|uniref:uncharacterized protein LOC122313674 n=1 Tax=Carya illinoinensis TaxID=32201 RepID=UPI001C721FED|nr:uncharacterized protein LOC122313674 [Carya illinoinensis]